MEGHLQAKGRTGRGLLFPEPGREGGREMCQKYVHQGRRAVLAVLLRGGTVDRKDSPVLRELTEQQGRESLLELTTQETLLSQTALERSKA